MNLKNRKSDSDSSLPPRAGLGDGTISITSIASISPLGTTLEEAWNGYLDNQHRLVEKEIGDETSWVAPLHESVQKEIELLKASDSKYKSLDDSVLYALYAARNAVKLAGWRSGENFGINIGSSRGATALFEKYHSEFLEQKRASTLSSPTTTLGNISSWVAHDLGSRGPEISHSITCSTALHALLNGVAWIKSGMATKFLVGGSEAPLTPFTIAQMKALKIYSRTPAPYPCRALDMEKTENSMALGEGASVICLEQGVGKDALALIAGVGYATEILEHNISISADAVCFQRSMKMALGEMDPSEVDIIVMHAPGTKKGDLSELAAIEKVFGQKIPALTTNKWKLGHTFGASGMLSLELAVLMLRHQQFVKVPFAEYDAIPEKINNVMINAVGFGGNAVSILLSRV
ncbi:beta-ketoacyl synthase [Flavobacteriaceae bacterium F89]|uniref:Beta-ketoacyl synthase n=1 Tax=Cerina litoralis TaxID=2874477 RepID=A0AAE3EW97_9FLAO|nr:beta-ketoacyl synthase N-terminal-like domain-containing protein [Cerina litoralis]MCG2460867.1 beta-ketoacyl synthase [Cerina litoralis]